MWLVDPQIMCRKHLLGEHLELHMFLGSLQKGKSVKGYIDKDLLQPRSLFTRHQELEIEMKRRGYTHNTKMNSNLVFNVIHSLPEDQLNHIIDKAKSLRVLLSRCEECKKSALAKRGL
jgi:hypothetical protein